MLKHSNGKPYTPIYITSIRYTPKLFTFNFLTVVVTIDCKTNIYHNINIIIYSINQIRNKLYTLFFPTFGNVIYYCSSILVYQK